MKRVLNLILFLTLTSIISCSSDENTDLPVPQDGQMVASINNETFIANDASANILNGLLFINGYDNEDDAIIFSIRDYKGVGTYDLGITGSLAKAHYIPNGEFIDYSSLTSEGSGTLIITEVKNNLQISGNFSFIAIGNRIDPYTNEVLSREEITVNGSFKNLFSYDGFPDINNDSLSTNINSTTFNPNNVVTSLINSNGQPSILISATDTETKENIGLSFPKQVGTFYFNSNEIGTIATGAFNSDITESLTPLFGQEGFVTVTNYNETSGLTEGIFSFTALDNSNQTEIVYSITGGEFSAVAK